MDKCNCLGIGPSERLIICIFEHFGRSWEGAGEELDREIRLGGLRVRQGGRRARDFEGHDAGRGGRALPLADGIVTVVCPWLGNGRAPW